MNVPSVFAGVDVSWNRFAENTLLLHASAGTATIKLGPNFPGMGVAPAPLTKTGLTNDANTYSASFLIDGTLRAFAAAGNTMQTVADLVTVLNAALAAWATVTLVNDAIVVTSLTTGVSSAVFVSDNTLGSQPDPRLFASIRGGQDIVTIPAGTFVAGSPRFGVLDYDSTRGWFNILATVVSATNRVGTSERGNNLYARFDNLEAVQAAQLSAVVDAFLAGGVANTNQPWLNAASSIAVPTGVPSLSTLTNLNRATVYQLRVNVNGAGNVVVFIDLNIVETQSFRIAGPINTVPFSGLVQAINNGLAVAVQADGTKLPVVCSWAPGYNATQPPRLLFTVVPSNELFTATSTGLVLQGTTSSLVLTDGASNGIVAALAAFGGVLDVAQAGYNVVDFHRVNAAAVTPTTVPAVATANYDATVNVDDAGVRTVYTVTVAVNVADTMTVIAASLQAAIRAATGETETAEAVGSTLLLSENQTGFNSYITVTIPTAGANPDLFRAIAAALDVVDPRGHTTVSTLSVDGFATPGVDGTSNVAFPKTVGGIAYADWQVVLTAEPIGGRTPSLPATAQFIHGATGFGPLFTSGSAAVFEKESRPKALGECVNRSVYWDGAAWRYFVADDASRLNTDDTTAGTSNPSNTLASGV